MEIKGMSRPVVGLLVVAGNVALGSTAYAAGATVTASTIKVTNGGSISMNKSGATTGDPVININDTNFYMGVKNASGEVNGMRATSTKTSLTGGSATTTETITDAGVKFSSTTSGSKDGTDARVTGVADGRINATSTDAINGSQLYKVKTKLDNTASKLDNVQTNLNNRIDHVKTKVDNTASKLDNVQTNLNKRIDHVQNKEGSLNFNKNLSATYSSGGEGGTYTDTPHNLTDAVNAETRRAMGQEKTLKGNIGSLNFNSSLVDGEGHSPTNLTQAVNIENRRAMTAEQAETDRATAAEQNLQNQLNTDVTTLNNRIDDVRDKAMAGIASAIAMTPSVMPSAPGKTAVSVGTGFYGGYSAVGINVTHAVMEWADHRGNVTFGASKAEGVGSSAKLGVGFEF